jgi:hypothetical protein
VFAKLVVLFFIHPKYLAATISFANPESLSSLLIAFCLS